MSKALFLVSLFSLTLHAGVVIKLKHFEGERPGPADRPKVEEMVHYVQGTKAKMETYGPNHELMHGTIFDADAQTFTNFNVKTKTYTKLDKTKFQAMANHMRDYLAEMKKKSPQHKAMLAKLPPDQRKKFEEQMKAMEKMQNATTKALTEEPKKIAENVKVGKYTCTKYEEQVAASRIENCNVPFDQVGIGPDEIKFFEKMAKMMEGLLGPAQMGPYTKSFFKRSVEDWFSGGDLDLP